MNYKQWCASGMVVMVSLVGILVWNPLWGEHVTVQVAGNLPTDQCRMGLRTTNASVYDHNGNWTGNVNVTYWVDDYYAVTNRGNIRHGANVTTTENVLVLTAPVRSGGKPDEAKITRVISNTPFTIHRHTSSQPMWKSLWDVGSVTMLVSTTQDPTLKPMSGTNGIVLVPGPNVITIYNQLSAAYKKEYPSTIQCSNPLQFTVNYTPPAPSTPSTTTESSTSSSTQGSSTAPATTGSTTTTSATSSETTTTTESGATATTATTETTPILEEEEETTTTAVSTGTDPNASNEEEEEATPKETRPNAYPRVGAVSRIEPPVGYHGGEVTFQVFVTDPDGIEDVAQVSVNLFPLKGNRVLLKRGKAERDGIWYEGTITIKPEVNPGTYNIEILATDKGGKSAFAMRPLQIVRTKEQVQLPDRPSSILEIRTEPGQITVGSTKDMMVYVEVRDEDGVGDIQAVIMDTTGLGRAERIPMAKIEDVDRFTGLYGHRIKDIDYLSPRTGNISFEIETVDGSNERFTKKHTIPVVVPGDDIPFATVEKTEELALTGEALTFLPGEVIVVAVAQDIIEMVLPVGINMESFRSNGAGLRLTREEDLLTTLPITRAISNATGTVLRIYSKDLKPGERYALWLDDTVQVGSGTVSHFPVKPVLTYPTPTVGGLTVERASRVTRDRVEVHFSKPIVPSSMLPNGANCIITGGGSVYQAASMEFRGPKTLILGFDRPIEGSTGHRLQCSNIVEPFSARAQTVVRTVDSGWASSPFDLNGDGRVNMIDFTLFTIDYGTSILAP